MELSPISWSLLLAVLTVAFICRTALNSAGTRKAGEQPGQAQRCAVYVRADRPHGRRG